MNIRQSLLAEHSKPQTMRIVEFIGADEKRFAELMNELRLIVRQYLPHSTAAFCKRVSQLSL